MLTKSLRTLLSAAACAAAAGLLPATDAAAQTGAYPAVSQTYSITAPGRWNQHYIYDLRTGAGSMSQLKSGSSTGNPYNLHSSFTVPIEEQYTNYVGLFIYDYTLRSWCEVFYVVDGSAFFSAVPQN